MSCIAGRTVCCYHSHLHGYHQISGVACCGIRQSCHQLPSSAVLLHLTLLSLVNGRFLCADGTTYSQHHAVTAVPRTGSGTGISSTASACLRCFDRLQMLIYKAVAQVCLRQRYRVMPRLPTPFEITHPIYNSSQQSLAHFQDFCMWLNPVCMHKAVRVKAGPAGR